MSKRRYAEGTTVSPEKSRMEIEQTLNRYGADAFSYGYEGERAAVMFRADGRYVRFTLTMPSLKEFEKVPGQWRYRTTEQQRSAQEKEIRRRWRALALVIKAKLEAVESELLTFEEEFMANLVLPDGSVVADQALPAIAQAYATGETTSILPNLRQLEAGEEPPDA